MKTRVLKLVTFISFSLDGALLLGLLKYIYFDVTKAKKKALFE